MAEQPMMDTAALITLVRRAPALAALREQPLDRRDLEEYLSVSKPTVHRLTRTLGEMGLVEKSGGLFVLTRLGEAVADVVSEFTRNVETAYRLAPLFEIQYPTLDISAFTDATVTTAVPGDPYRPMQRYYSLVEQTATLRGFDTTVLSPEYVDAIHRQVRDGMETELIYPPAVAAHLLSAHPERVTELFESGHLVFHVHVDLP
ncbi:MAG TPA: helix-turn-helix domain-containing protein, partial [Halococcus sp.]|nr:helix-turn-helix domain-containing protein [Halococcus sp.]